ncbi:hypothetical protein R1flu_019550 [Riccia fluitans]|uniref:Methyltransferase type 11 domain-containing protein n=1 Tax=Riccia fluitans TaxID=41844 RepID=A0ABD1ZIY4_9MARC
MGRAGRRGWMKVYEIYGVQEARVVAGLIWQAIAFSVPSGLLYFYFSYCTRTLASVVRFVPVQLWAFIIGFFMGAMVLMAICFIVTAGNFLYTNVVLRHRIARRMVGMVEDWSKVESVLDVGCGRGLLLNTVALRLKKEGCGGRVVGVDLWLNNKKSGKTMASTLYTSKLEQTQEYVTCKSGDARDLPFTDKYFDAVVSALCLNSLGEEYGRSTARAAKERLKGLQEIIRVLKPGGQVVIWDMYHGQEYEAKLKELGMENVTLSESIPAFMLPSHIVSFKKPLKR